jgi:hypothetical protein
MVLFGVLWPFFVSLFANEPPSTPAAIMADEVGAIRYEGAYLFQCAATSY